MPKEDVAGYIETLPGSIRYLGLFDLDFSPPREPLASLRERLSQGAPDFLPDANPILIRNFWFSSHRFYRGHGQRLDKENSFEKANSFEFERSLQV